MKISVLLCGLVVAATSVGSTAFAATAPGLWNYSMTMAMPGMPTLTPEMRAQMQAMGMVMPGMGAPMVIQACITAAQAARSDTPPPPKNCQLRNQRMNGRTFYGEVVCTGEYAGTGTIEGTFDSDRHFTQKVAIQRAGAPGAMNMTIEGTHVGADCGNVKPVEP